MSEPGRVIDEAEVMVLFEAAVQKAGSARAFAKQMGVSGAYISAILRGKKAFTARILATIGVEVTPVYRIMPGSATLQS